MKRLVFTGILLILLGVTYSYKEDLVRLCNKLFINISKNEVSLGKVNDYYRDYDFQFVQNTSNFSPHSREDILNIYYTVINAGKDKFTFYCPSEYEDCLDEVNYLANDQTLLSHINNYVHPFNGFKNIETEYDSLGKVTISIQKSYTESEIKEISDKLEKIEEQIFNNKATTLDNIKNAHDYIINNSKYDSLRSDENIVNYKSDIAYGPLIQGYGLCGGYTDAMELFLEDLDVKSFKISSENHVWNAVNYNDTWLHLDLTWDDPVVSDGSDVLDNNFFMIDSNKLASLETGQHAFDLTVYKEFK